MGAFEAGPLGSVEAPVKYHPYSTGVLTEARNPGPGHCQAGSLTGAVASQSVTERKKRKAADFSAAFHKLSRRRPTFPRSCPRSIIGDAELNCRVRNGNGCDLCSMTTGNL